MSLYCVCQMAYAVRGINLYFLIKLCSSDTFVHENETDLEPSCKVFVGYYFL